MVQNKIQEAIRNGNLTDEQIQNSTGLSPNAVKIGVKGLINSGIVSINPQGYYSILSGTNEVFKNNTFKNKKGDKMNSRNLRTTRGKFSISPKLNCTPEQEQFGILVQENKGAIFDAEVILEHRGAQIVFAGAGNQAFMYRIGISGYSDKEEIEMPSMYLDWDDTALYDEGGIADQIREILGASTPKPTIAPAITAQAVGK